MEPTIGLVTVSRNITGLTRLLRWAYPYFDQIYLFPDKKVWTKMEPHTRGFGAIIEPLDVGGVVENVLQYAYDKVETDWVVRLDDDELLGERWEQSYREMMKLPIDVFLLPRYNLAADGVYINDPDRYPDYQTRFFRKGHVKHMGKVHEGPIGIGTSVATDCHIFHFSKLDYSREEREAKWKVYNREGASEELARQYGRASDYYRQFSVWEDYPAELSICEERCAVFKAKEGK